MRLVEVVGVDVGIAKGVDIFARLEPCDLRHHHEQKGIRSDVERHAEKYVAAALIELKAEFAVGHIELKEGVARRQRHVGHLSHIPRAHYYASAVWGVLDLIYGLGYLVDMASLIVGPRAPLIAVDMAQVAILISPLVPNAHTVILQIAHIGIALEKPKEFVDYRLQMHLLGGEQRKSVGKIKAHLVAKHALCTRARAVALLHSVFEHMLYQIEILFHRLFLLVITANLAKYSIILPIFTNFAKNELIMKIWVNINGIQSGPMSREALAEMVTDPSVTYVWHQGMSNWQRIDLVPEFADIVAASKTASEPQPQAEDENLAVAVGEEALESAEAEIVVPQADSDGEVQDDPAENPEPKEAQPQIPPIPAQVPPIPHYYAPQQQYQPQYQPSAPAPAPQGEIPSTYMAMSIIFTIICCNAIGILAIVFSALTSQNIKSGDLAAARRYSEYAAFTIMITIAAGLVLMPLQMLLFSL